MLRSLMIAAVVLSASSSYVHAHALWITVVEEGTKQAVKVWYSDHPEPGRVSMMKRLSKLKVSARNVPGKDFSLSLEEVLGEETGELTAPFELQAPFVLEAICDIGVREPRSHSARPQREGSQLAENREQKARPQQSREQGSRGKTQETADSGSPFREIYFSKFVSSDLLSNPSAVKNEKFQLDLIPRVEGKQLTLSVLQNGQPAEEVSVSLSGPDNLKERTKSNANGEVKLDSLKPGRYVVRAKGENLTPGEVEGQAFSKTVLTSSLIFDIK